MRSLIHRLRSDEALMLAYQHGDAEAFEQLYQRHKDALFAFLYQSCGNKTVVEEVAQDTWVAVIQATERYESSGRFKPWLYRIARNRLVDFWRLRDNQHAPLEVASEQASERDNPQLEDGAKRIMAAVAALPPDQRDTILLHEQGFSHAQIGQITDAPAETVKSRLRYARKQLRAWLDAEPGATHA